MGFRNQTQVICLDDKKFNPLSHLSSCPSMSCLQRCVHTAKRWPYLGGPGPVLPLPWILATPLLDPGHTPFGTWSHPFWNLATPLCLASWTFNLSSQPLPFQAFSDQSSLPTTCLHSCLSQYRAWSHTLHQGVGCCSEHGWAS